MLAARNLVQRQPTTMVKWGERVTLARANSRQTVVHGATWRSGKPTGSCCLQRGTRTPESHTDLWSYDLLADLELLEQLGIDQCGGARWRSRRGILIAEPDPASACRRPRSGVREAALVSVDLDSGAAALAARFSTVTHFSPHMPGWKRGGSPRGCARATFPASWSWTP